MIWDYHTYFKAIPNKLHQGDERANCNLFKIVPHVQTVVLLASKAMNNVKLLC